MVEHELPRQLLAASCKLRQAPRQTARPPGLRALALCADVLPRLQRAALLAMSLALLAATSGAARAASAAVDAQKAGTGSGEVLGLIVRYADLNADAQRASAEAQQAARAARAATVNALAAAQGRTAKYARTLASGAELVQFDQAMTLAASQALAERVAQLPGVRYVAPNRVIRPQVTPTDPDFGSQWGFRYSPGVEEGANFVAAWDVTQGNATQTIGIVDGGISRSNEELAPKLRTAPAFPLGGYDFIDDATSAADGDGRDSDPEQVSSACGHGTHVAGTIAAQTTFAGTGVGVAGGAPLSKVLIGRAFNVLGADADAIDAMHWMAGSAVPGVAQNPNVPAVLNMSFGGGGACGGGYQEAVDALRAAGVVPVAAAGNNNGDAADFSPANCRGVIAVAASDSAGMRASFSNYGSTVTLTAPGVGILSTGGSGASNVSCSKQGTSMAAPHVAAAAALLRTVAPSLSVDQVTLALKAGARAFPAASNCTTASCGAGLLDARAALDAVTGSTARLGWSDAELAVRENVGNVVLRVSRVGGAGQAISATVSASNGTASAGLDYDAPTPATLSWAVGDSSDRTVTVPILRRSGQQSSRQFTVRMQPGGANAQVAAPDTVNVTINDVDCASVIPISYGQTLAGSIDAAHPENYCHSGARGSGYNTVRYSFGGQAGDIVSIDLTSTTATPAVLDTYLFLLDPNQAVLAQNDDLVANVVRNSGIARFQLTQTGTHFIEVTTWHPTVDASGSYNLQLLRCGTSAGPTCSVDADGDGTAGSSDVLLIARRALGFSGAALVSGVAANSCATRTSGDAVAAFLDPQLAPPNPKLDFDGDGKVFASTDALLLLRALLGLSGPAVTDHAIGTGAARGSWTLLRDYLSTQCGLTVAP